MNHWSYSVVLDWLLCVFSPRAFAWPRRGPSIWGQGSSQCYSAFSGLLPTLALCPRHTLLNWHWSPRCPWWGPLLPPQVSWSCALSLCIFSRLSQTTTGYLQCRETQWIPLLFSVSIFSRSPVSLFPWAPSCERQPVSRSTSSPLKSCYFLWRFFGYRLLLNWLCLQYLFINPTELIDVHVAFGVATEL